jgi:hypothetical protein
MDIRTMTQDEIRKAGMDALVKALGPVGMIRFLQIYSQGKGNYTEERGEWLDKLEMDEILEDIKEGTKAVKEKMGKSKTKV